MAVAGVSPGELDVTVEANALRVSGKSRRDEEKKNVNGYPHHGIARHSFERCFSLTDHMKVTGAHLDNGMLRVELIHEVPEAAKPRRIEIGTGTEPPQVTE
jgi:molecular chaperone IbpA